MTEMFSTHCYFNVNRTILENATLGSVSFYWENKIFTCIGIYHYNGKFTMIYYNTSDDSVLRVYCSLKTKPHKSKVTLFDNSYAVGYCYSIL